MSPFWLGFLPGLFIGGAIGFIGAALLLLRMVEENTLFTAGGMIEPDKKDDYPVIVLPRIGGCYYEKKGSQKGPNPAPPQLRRVTMENGWMQRVEELEAEVAKLTTALKDKPDQSDLDAAVFRINHLEAENKRKRLREGLK